MSEQDLEQEVNTFEVEPQKQDFFSMSDEELANVSFSSAEVVKEEPETTEPEENVEEVKDEVDNETDKPFDYEAAYKKITAPIKANGKDMTFEDPDDIRTLMQKGVGYDKGVVGNRKARQIAKTLEQAGIDSERLNFLIDIKKNNPDAIKQLLKDSGINPLEIDNEEVSKYVPTNYKVDEKVVALEDVVGSINNTPKYQTTVEIITQQWDNKSSETMLNNPKYIATLNEHVHNGVYDQIDAILQKEKLLGRLEGLSDLDAYIQIGNYMENNGLFSNQVTKPTTEIVQPVVQTKQEDINKQKKLAASPTKAVAKSKPVDATTIDWLNLPPDEFARLEKELKLR